MRASSVSASAVASSNHSSSIGRLYEIEMSASPESVVRKLTSRTLRCSTSEREMASSVGPMSALMRSEPIGYESTSRGMSLSSRLYMTKCRVASGSTPSRHTWKLARIRKCVLGERKTSIGGSD